MSKSQSQKHIKEIEADGKLSVETSENILE